MSKSEFLKVARRLREIKRTLANDPHHMHCFCITSEEVEWLKKNLTPEERWRVSFYSFWINTEAEPGRSTVG